MFLRITTRLRLVLLMHLMIRFVMLEQLLTLPTDQPNTSRARLPSLVVRLLITERTFINRNDEHIFAEQLRQEPADHNSLGVEGDIGIAIFTLLEIVEAQAEALTHNHNRRYTICKMMYQALHRKLNEADLFYRTRHLRN
jgi:hypothetical protein